jgi:trans-aconitate 2-methyltransferase
MSTDVHTFWQQRAAIDGPTATRFNRDMDAYDLAAVTALGGPGTRALDLGCGTCEIANRLVADHGWAVHAVDFVEDFLAHAVADPRLTTEQADVATYVPDREYDVILALGMIMYLEDPAQRDGLYRNCARALPAGGTLFVKAQFGVAEEVVVDTYSEALGADYRAVYPQLAAEAARMDRFFDVAVTDPFPASFSPWPNTHWHYLTGRRR